MTRNVLRHGGLVACATASPLQSGDQVWTPHFAR